VDVPNDVPLTAVQAKKAGFVILDLNGWPLEHTPGEVKPTPENYHLNALGQKLVAEKLYEAVLSHPEALPPFHARN
jgi:hypothetical protein